MTFFLAYQLLNVTHTFEAGSTYQREELEEEGSP
jgi:hypothetical protein